MRALLIVCLYVCIGLIPGACSKRQQTTVILDACSLISKDDVASVQKTAVKEAKNTDRLDGTLRISQCLYTAAEYSRSVNLALVQTDPNQPGKRGPKDFWKEKFDPYENEAPGANRDEKEQGPAPKRINGLGDEAFWVTNRFGGMLYVLKGDVFLSIGIGGTDDEETKLVKSKVLAQKALQKL